MRILASLASVLCIAVKHPADDGWDVQYITDIERAIDDISNSCIKRLRDIAFVTIAQGTVYLAFAPLDDDGYNMYATSGLFTYADGTAPGISWSDTEEDDAKKTVLLNGAYARRNPSFPLNITGSELNTIMTANAWPQP